jgi:hypothetical protein
VCKLIPGWCAIRCSALSALSGQVPVLLTQ